MAESLRVVLVRLAECEGNVRQLVRRHGRLTEAGREQAIRSRQRIIPLGIRAWVSADNSACRETAAILSGGAPTLVLHEFDEPPYGEWEGKTLAEVRERWPEEFDRYGDPKPGDADRVIVPGGESLRSTLDRARRGLDKLLAEFAGAGAVVICTHGEVVRLAMAALLGAPLENLFRLRGRNAAVTIFDYDGERTVFEVINDTAHLATGPAPKDLFDYLKT